MFPIKFWCNKRLVRGVMCNAANLLGTRFQNEEYTCTESEEDYGTAGAVLLSWIFSGLGIRQFSVYIVFCNKGVI